MQRPVRFDLVVEAMGFVGMPVTPFGGSEVSLISDVGLDVRWRHARGGLAFSLNLLLDLLVAHGSS